VVVEASNLSEVNFGEHTKGIKVTGGMLVQGLDLRVVLASSLSWARSFIIA